MTRLTAVASAAPVTALLGLVRVDLDGAASVLFAVSVSFALIGFAVATVISAVAAFIRERGQAALVRAEARRLDRSSPVERWRPRGNPGDGPRGRGRTSTATQQAPVSNTATAG